MSMQNGFKAVLAARALLRAAGESTLAVGRPGGDEREKACQWCRPALSEGGRTDRSIDRPIGQGGKFEVVRHGR
jgi:hypothetical protein